MAILRENNGDAPVSPLTQYELSPGNTFRGNIAHTETFFPIDDGLFHFDGDVLRIVLTAGQTYRFAINGRGEQVASELALMLLDARGNNFVVNGNSSVGMDAEITYTARTTGTYYVGIGSQDTGDYELSVVETAPPNMTILYEDDGDAPFSLFTQYILSPGDTFRGYVEHTETLLQESYFNGDMLRIELVAGQTYELQLNGYGWLSIPDPVIALYDAKANQLAFDDDSGSGLNSALVFTAPATGAYFIGVSSHYGEGVYELSISETEQPPVSPSPVRENFVHEDNGDAPFSLDTSYSMAAGDVFRGSITAVETLTLVDDELQFAGDVIRIELTAGQTYEFKLNGYGNLPADDPAMGIADDQGNFFATDDDSGPGLNAALTFSAPVSGEYYIAIGSYDEGDYELSVVEVDTPPDPEPEISPALEVASNDKLAGYLTDGYWADSGSSGRRSFQVGADGALTVDITSLNAEGRQLARWALEAWASVTGIRFEFVNGDAEITFTDHEPGAFSRFLGVNNIASATVNVSTEWLGQYGTTLDSYSFQTYLHEIGHVLGLGHPGNYNTADSNSEVTYENDARFLNDSWQLTVMSYFSQEENTHIRASNAYVVTPMIVDIIAIQELYDIAAENNPGDTIYGYNSNADGYLGELLAQWAADSLSYPVALTLYDTGGHDTLDLHTDASDQWIDLRPEGISNVYGLRGNLVIARDTVIEDVIAGIGYDRIIGNDAGNYLDGGPGNDRLSGGEGDDLLHGGAGADHLIGGAGLDVASYQDSDAGVRVNLATSAATGGHANGDLLEEVEGVIGSYYDDVLTGDSADNLLLGGPGDDRLSGNQGDDVLSGGAGADHLSGGGGFDIVIYQESDAGIYINLASGAAIGGHAQGDTVVQIEGLFGSAYDDELTGNDDSNILHGYKGDDRLTGGAGADVFVFDAGSDVVTDFTDGEDWIDLSEFGLAGFNALDIQQTGSDAVIDLGSGDNLTLLNIDQNLLGAEDFLF